MSDEQILEEEPQVTLAHYVQACGEVIDEFRTYLVSETDRLTRVRSKQLGRDYQFGGALAQLDPQMHARLHQLRIASDNFLNALKGQY
jgi:hypothetical protein